MHKLPTAKRSGLHSTIVVMIMSSIVLLITWFDRLNPAPVFALLLALLVTVLWQTLRLLMHLWQSLPVWYKQHGIGLAILGAIWLVIASAIIICFGVTIPFYVAASGLDNMSVVISESATNGILIGLLLLFVTAIITRRRDATPRLSSRGSHILDWVISYYSAIFIGAVITVAYSGIGDEISHRVPLVVLVAVQLQYVVQHIMLRTEYLPWARDLANSLYTRLGSFMISRNLTPSANNDGLKLMLMFAPLFAATFITLTLALATTYAGIAL